MAKDNKEVKKAEKPVIPSKGFKIEGEGEFKFKVADFKYKGKDYKSVDALKDANLLAELVSIKAGIIEPVGAADSGKEGE